jgi:hypothetical protein
MPILPIHRHGSECDGLADAGLRGGQRRQSSVGQGRFRFSVFRLRPAKAGLRRTRRFSVVSSELGSMQASPYPKNAERGSFVSGISYN